MMTNDSRSLKERIAAKAMHWVGVRLTPNTFYWMNQENPFRRLIDDEASKVFKMQSPRRLPHLNILQVTSQTPETPKSPRQSRGLMFKAPRGVIGKSE